MMHTFYPQLWKGLRLVEGLEKIATHDRALSTFAQTNSATVASELFTQVKQAAERLPGPNTIGVKVARLMVDMRNAHRATGEKLAVDISVHADMLQKLATALFVDDVIEAEITKLAGDEQVNARNIQLLGREYAVHLMDGLLS
jgi:hypothetical protein